MNGLLLVIIVVGLYVAHLFNKKKVSYFFQKLAWDKALILPFHSIYTLHFWLIGLGINSIIFILFVFQQEAGYLSSILVVGLLFSFLDALLEEVIWRGMVLASLQKEVSTLYAVLVSSIGFGLLHLAIDFPLITSLLFLFRDSFMRFLC